MVYPNFRNKHSEAALFSPKEYLLPKFKKKKIKFPKKYILIYDRKLMKRLVRKYKLKKSKKIVPNADFYWFRDIGIIKMKGIGSPHAVTVFEEFIALGGKRFVNIGTAGGLQTEGFFLCKKALRDEGTSYHYIPHGDYSYPDEKLTKKLGKILNKMGIKYKDGITWTIDAPYRETKAEVKKYKRMGITTVEMEASALFAVATVKKVKIASAFVVSDVLGEKWEPKFDHINTKKGLNILFEAAVGCLK